ncbi:MAG: hypothetical protein Q9M40_07395 [Sulfurimonas sp.]|nr:hypothetical protein [Sulfurimonas sp.]
MAFQAIQNNIVPPLIENEHRTKYLTAINDKDELLKFIDESIQNSMDLLD